MLRDVPALCVTSVSLEISFPRMTGAEPRNLESILLILAATSGCPGRQAARVFEAFVLDVRLQK